MIVLQFTAQDDLGSKMIRWFSHGDYSHVDTVLPDGRLFGARSDRVGGQPPGVFARDPSYVDGSKTFRVELPVGPQTESRYFDFLKRQEGKPYDSIGIVGFALGRNWRDNDSWFCSELVAAGLETAGYFHALFVPSNKITPSDLLLALSVKTEVPEDMEPA